MSGDIPILLRDLAHVQIGPEMRRAVADLDGEGEITGGIIVMRQGENALATIERVKQRLQTLKAGLPEGVEIVETYDRSGLILSAVDNLTEKLIEEFIVVALVCVLFLFHLRSSFVAIITLPLGILISFIIMREQGINANIMSLGGIAIAIGAMVDAAIVMIENAHKHLENADPELSGEARWQVIAKAATEVGPALFYSLLIITLSFLPVFTLQAQEGRLFSPLAYTKTFAMAASAGLAVTLVPVLMGYFIRGRVPRESSNPLNTLLIWLYRPALRLVLAAPRTTLLLSLLAVLSMTIPLYGVEALAKPLEWSLQAMRAIVPSAGDALHSDLEHSKKSSWKQDWTERFRDTPWLARLGEGLGREFMPELFEGDLMYMPSTLPGISIGKARELLQQTDRLIKQTPEVERVFGKIGRADTATDPAPLTMIETLIQLKPREQWRPGMTWKKLKQELDQRVNFPALPNAWLMPIKTRLDMLATGIKTPIGVKVAGPDIHEIERIGRQVEQLIKTLPGTRSVYSERVAGGRYIDIQPKRLEAARLGLNIERHQRYRERRGRRHQYHPDRRRTGTLPGQSALSPGTAGRCEEAAGTAAGHRHWRADPPVPDRGGAGTWTARRCSRARTPVSTAGPMWISMTWIWAAICSRRNNASASRSDCRRAIRSPGPGQYEYMVRAEERLRIAIPLTLTIIFILLFLIFRSTGEALMVMLSLPFALVGGVWLLLLLDFKLSVAVAVGFIALAGVAAEFGIVMLIYLNNALAQTPARGPTDQPQWT